jgi:anti-sigma factor RsiW
MRMNCHKVLSRLHAYLDGEASEKLMMEMGEHLRACPSCRAQVERIRQTGAVLDSLSVPPLPHAFASRVVEQARRKALPANEKKSLLSLGWQPFQWLFDLSIPMRAAACAMVLLACALGLFMSREASISGGRQAATLSTRDVDGFEWFNPAPPVSLGAAYFTLASTSMDERGTP